MPYSIRTIIRSLVIGAFAFAVLALATPFRAGAQTMITNAIGPTNGFYGVGSKLIFTVQYNSNVTVSGGPPEIGLTIGTNEVEATNVIGPATNFLVFSYTVQLGDNSGSSGITVDAGIETNGALIQDLSANVPATNFTAPATAGVIVDTTPPVVSISGPVPTIVNSNTPVVYMVIVTNANIGPGSGSGSLTAAGIKVISSGGALAGGTNVTLFSHNAGTNIYTVTLTNCTGDGSLTITVLAGAETDLAGNTNAQSGPSGSVTVDNTPPTVTISGPSPTNVNLNTPLVYTVTFFDTNMGPTNLAQVLTNIQVNTITGLAVAGSTNVSVLTNTATTNVYAVTLASCTGNGTLGITVLSGAQSDKAGNLSGMTRASGTFIVDNIAPAIQISAPSRPYTSSNTVSYTVTYSDSNLLSTTLTTANVTVNPLPPGFVSGTTLVTSNSPTMYTVAVTNITGNGQLSITIAAGTARDIAGNFSAATNSSAFTVDNINPSVTVGPPSVPFTNASGQVTFMVHYYDLNFATAALSSNNVVVTSTGNAAAASVTVSNVLGAPSTNFLVTLSGLTGDGTLTVAVTNGVASDLAGNLDVGAASITNFIVYTNPPAVTITGPSTNFGNSGNQVSYTVNVNDPYLFAAPLASNNIVQVPTGSARATSITVVEDTADSNATNVIYTVTLGALAGQGTIAFKITNGFAYDRAGNTNLPTAISTNFAVNAIAPQIVITGPSPVKTTNGPSTYTITYRSTNAFVITLDPANITLNQTGSATGTLLLFTNLATNSYTLVITNISLANTNLPGTLGFSITNGTAYDTNGNFAAAATASTNVLVLSGTGGAGAGAATLGIKSPTAISLTLTLQGVPGATYKVQTTTNLGSTNWLSAGTTKLDSTGNGTLTIFGGYLGDPTVPAQFYRAMLP